MRGAREYIFFGQLIERNRAFSSIYAQHLRFFELLEIDRELKRQPISVNVPKNTH